MIDDLRRGLLLSRLTEAQLERVHRLSHRVRLGEGQWLFSQGDEARRFFLVLQGQMKLFRLSPEGNEKIIEIISPGNTFAEALMFLERPYYPVCAAALSKVELVSMDARDFSLMLRDSVDTCFLILGDLSQRLRGLIGEIDRLTLHGATGRVASYLLERACEHGESFDLDVRKSVVASRLSIKPETFSRAIKSLSDQGLITVEGSRFSVLDREALAETAKL
jgi:CRP-like cAMP-binding protein